MPEIYELSDKTKQLIVDSLRQGFVEFIEEKAKKKKEMIVSAGYAWTRGNHIDNQIYKSLKNANLATSEIFKVAGWEFLRFDLNEDNHKIWIVQKAVSFIHKKSNFAKQDAKHQNLISQWSNNVNSKYESLFSRKAENLENIVLIGDDSAESHDFNESISEQIGEAEAFYLLTYEVSKDNDISSIKLNIVYDGKVKTIEDLDVFNAASSVEIPAEVRNQLDHIEVINPKVEPSTDYDFYADATVKENESKKGTDQN